MSNELPQGWITKKLKDLVLPMQTGFACGAHSRTGAGVAHLRPMNVTTGGRISLSDLKLVPSSEVNREDRWLREGDVVFNNTNSPELVGKTAYYNLPEPRAFSNHMTRLRCQPALEPQYCAAFLHYAWRTGLFASACNNHVSQASIGRDVLGDVDIPLPPRTEQRRIVAKVEALLDRVSRTKDHLDRVVQILKRFRQAVLGSACAGRLTEDFRGRHNPRESAEAQLVKIRDRRQKLGLASGRRQIDDEGIDIPDDELPDGWVWTRVGHVADVRLGGTPSRKESTYWKGSIPWVSSGEVANCRISSTTETITKKGLASSNAKLYPAGSVLIAMIGEGKTRGQSAILDIEACTNQNAAGLIFDAGMMNPEYVWYWALSEYENNRGEGRGGNQAALNGAKVRALPFPLPPLEEQAEVVRIAGSLLRLADVVEQRLHSVHRSTESAPQSILSKAFAGELVPTDADLARLPEAESQQTPQRHRTKPPTKSRPASAISPAE